MEGSFVRANNGPTAVNAGMGLPQGHGLVEKRLSNPNDPASAQATPKISYRRAGLGMAAGQSFALVRPSSPPKLPELVPHAG
ncbi:hypothetical protein PG996_008845 [Apiospora saccharicola]|uniref:Uncharacterized protein n=1 Tax=Apiospora saccharicola TaxID=335842 RepID=A0ABR1UZ50_9PEZI